MHEDFTFKTLLIFGSTTVWIVCNIMLPLFRLSDFVYDDKKSFWKEVLIPYYLAFKLLNEARKYLGKELMELLKIYKGL